MPPSFLREWEDELESLSDDLNINLPSKSMTKIAYDLAALRAGSSLQEADNLQAADVVLSIDRRLSAWAVEATSCDTAWAYSTSDVSDAEDVWNGTVHAYNSSSTIAAWNTFRCLRLLTMNTLENLVWKMPISPDDKQEYTRYVRDVRRQMVDEVCFTIPCILGYGESQRQLLCDVMSAYNIMWPLFLAGSSALQRAQAEVSQSANLDPTQPLTVSAASAQATWIMGRLKYVSESLGLRWARGVVAILERNHMSTVQQPSVVLSVG